MKESLSGTPGRKLLAPQSRVLQSPQAASAKKAVSFSACSRLVEGPRQPYGRSLTSALQVVSICALVPRCCPRRADPDREERLRLLLGLLCARAGRLHLVQDLLLDFVRTAALPVDMVIADCMVSEAALPRRDCCNTFRYLVSLPDRASDRHRQMVLPAI